MGEQAALDAFPRRPIAVRVGWRDRLVMVGSALLALAALVAAGWLAWQFGPGLVRDARVWRDGRPAPVTQVAGSCTVQVSWLPFSWCDFQVSFRDADGAERTRPVSALTFFGFDRSAPPSVKVDPQDPEAVALSWFATETPLRWPALLASAGGLLLLAGVIGAGARAALGELRLFRALARDPHPVAAAVDGVRLVSSPGWAREITFRYRGPDGAERVARQRLTVLKGEHGVAPENWTYEEPIPLARNGGRLLALAGERGARLVKASFAPLQLTDGEKRRLLQAASAASGVR